MKRETQTYKVHPNLVFTAVLSSSLTIVLSIIYLVLSIVAIVYRFQCDPDADINASNFFWRSLFTVYIQKADCLIPSVPPAASSSEETDAVTLYSITSIPQIGLTHSDTVFLLMVFTLVVSVLALVAASVLIAVARDENHSNYINLAGYVYIGICVAVFVVDLTFSIHFGMDYGLLNDYLNDLTAGSATTYFVDMVRLAAFFLMFVALKGFIAHAINLTLLIILVVYLVEHQRALQKHDHSIHKMGALNAFEQQRRPEDPWQPQSDMFLALPRNAQTNSAYVNDDDLSPLPSGPRSPMREQTMSDYSNNRYYDRSESWQRRSPSGSRPFSYLEEPRRPIPVKPPPVPAPDYSPPARRLKSAMKPGYM